MSGQMAAPNAAVAAPTGMDATNQPQRSLVTWFGKKFEENKFATITVNGLTVWKESRAINFPDPPTTKNNSKNWECQEPFFTPDSQDITVAQWKRYRVHELLNVDLGPKNNRVYLNASRLANYMGFASVAHFNNWIDHYVQDIVVDYLNVWQMSSVPIPSGKEFFKAVEEFNHEVHHGRQTLKVRYTDNIMYGENHFWPILNSEINRRKPDTSNTLHGPFSFVVCAARIMTHGFHGVTSLEGWIFPGPDRRETEKGDVFLRFPMASWSKAYCVLRYMIASLNGELGVVPTLPLAPIRCISWDVVHRTEIKTMDEMHKAAVRFAKEEGRQAEMLRLHDAAEPREWRYLW